MSVKSCEKLEKSKVALTIEVSAEDFEAAINKAYLKMRGKMNIPGFRPGKAPRKIVESMYGVEVFYEEAVNIVLPDAYEKAISDEKLEVVGYPEVELENCGKDGVTFKATVAVYPEVKLGQYKGLEAPKAAVKVMAADVNARLKEMAERNSRLVSVERAVKKGDTANIDFEGFDNGVAFDGGKGENFDLEIGSGSFVPGFEEQLIGMKVGEEKDIDITFPEDYVENLAGKAVVFKVKLNSLTTPELPELDDDFAQDVSEFDTFDEYKADVRSSMEKAKSDEADAKFRTEIMTQACDNLVVDLPETMIDMKLNEILRNYAANFGVTGDDVKTEDLMKLMGLDKDTVDATLRPAAVYQVKQELLLEAVAAAENIEVTDEDTDEYIKGAAETVNAKPEDILNYFGMDFIRNEFKKEKATKIIIESASVSEGEAE